MQLLPKPPKPQHSSAPKAVSQPSRTPLKVVKTDPETSAKSAKPQGQGEHTLMMPNTYSDAPLFVLQPGPMARHERVIIFIDGSNLFYAALQLGLEVDYTKLLQCLTRGRPLVRAYFYTGADPANPKQQGFLMWMRRNGYRVVAKNLIQHADGSKKANLDIEMAIDMLSLAQHCDTVVLLSGNGDLTYAVENVSRQGVQVELISLPSMLNEGLKNTADLFVDLTALKPYIQKSSESDTPKVDSHD